MSKKREIHSIAFRLAGIVCLVSLALTLMATCFEVWMEHADQKRIIQKKNTGN